MKYQIIFGRILYYHYMYYHQYEIYKYVFDEMFYDVRYLWCLMFYCSSSIQERQYFHNIAIYSIRIQYDVKRWWNSNSLYVKRLYFHTKMPTSIHNETKYISIQKMMYFEIFIRLDIHIRDIIQLRTNLSFGTNPESYFNYSV